MRAKRSSIPLVAALQPSMRPSSVRQLGASTRALARKQQQARKQTSDPAELLDVQEYRYGLTSAAHRTLEHQREYLRLLRLEQFEFPKLKGKAFALACILSSPVHYVLCSAQAAVHAAGRRRVCARAHAALPRRGAPGRQESRDHSARLFHLFARSRQGGAQAEAARGRALGQRQGRAQDCVRALWHKGAERTVVLRDARPSRRRCRGAHLFTSLSGALKRECQDLSDPMDDIKLDTRATDSRLLRSGKRMRATRRDIPADWLAAAKKSKHALVEGRPPTPPSS